MRPPAAEARDVLVEPTVKFVQELRWRDFAYHLLFHFPTLPEKNWKPAFDAYPWRDATADLARWKTIIDSIGYKPS